MRWKGSACLVIGLLTGAGAPPKADVKDDLEALQGGWSMVMFFISGEEVPADQVKTGELIIDGDECHPKLSANVETASIKLNASTNPKAIDFTYAAGFQKGKTIKGIYKLEDDILTICRGATPEKDRPAEFAAPTGSGLMLVVWRRSKTVGGEKLKAIQVERKRFEATWRFVSVEVEGNMVPVEAFKEDTLVLKGRQFTSNIQGKTTHGVFKIDPTAKPKAIDITFTDGPGKDITQKGIYELEGETQRICFAAPGKPRPTAFRTGPGSGTMIQVLERLRPQAAATPAGAIQSVRPRR